MGLPAWGPLRWIRKIAPASPRGVPRLGLFVLLGWLSSVGAPPSAGADVLDGSASAEIYADRMAYIEKGEIYVADGDVSLKKVPNDSKPDPSDPTKTATVIEEEARTAGIPPYDKEPYSENTVRDEWDPKQPQRQWY